MALVNPVRHWKPFTQIALSKWAGVGNVTFNNPQHKWTGHATECGAGKRDGGCGRQPQEPGAAHGQGIA